RRRERSGQAAKGSHHMLVIAGTVLVEPRLVIVPREFLEKAERIGCETLESNRHSCLLRKVIPVTPNYIRWSRPGTTKRPLFKFNFLRRISRCCFSTPRPLTYNREKIRARHALNFASWHPRPFDANTQFRLLPSLI